MEALNGTCLKIPCNYSVKNEREFDNKRETFGIWFKEDKETSNPKNVFFNSSGTVNKFQMNITGNLRMKNCTTLIYNMKTTYEGVYYFRIMNWPFRATAVCDSLQIKVKDSPPSPKLIISGDLKEKESVTITCSASTPCPLSPPKLTWTLKQDSLNNMEENPDKTFTTKIQEQITLTDKHDGYNITCSATYPVNEGKEVKTAEETQTLRVSYAPKNTSVSISPSGLVSAGIHVNLTCSSRANPPVSSFTWFKISRDGPMIVSEGEFYSFNVTEGGVYYCVSMNDLGNQTSPQIHLRFEEKDSPPSPKLIISGDLKEKESVTITCSASTPCPLSPPKLTWNLKQDSLNNMEENPDKTFMTKIQEQITLTDKHDGYNITCSATYPVNEGKEVKTAEETQTLRVSYSPKNTSASISPSGLVSAGIHVNLTCSSRANPPVSSFTWFKISRDGPMIVSEGEFYSFNATEGGVYYCVSMNDLSNQTSPQIHLSVAEKPVDAPLSPLWGSAVGIIVVVVCLAVCIWWLMRKHQTPQQNQSQGDGVLATYQPPNETEETIHYGEINFSVRGPEQLSVSVQDSGQQQDTLYAQVKVSKPASSRTQPADGPEDIYAQVRKK
ncbi:vascular cell adhesion protein 1-like [Labrus bergylta]|uniref:vascular cell adhesion protein 1-like n=1 Tax=Labrus bergylta TaxID=56723 RepID=UPI003313F213